MPKSAKSFRRHLTLGDVAIASHGLLVTLQFTKTIQFGGRHLPFFFACRYTLPVSPYLRMIRLVRARCSCPGFFIPGHKDLVPRTKHSFVSSFCPYLVTVEISNTQSFRGAA